MAGTFGSFVVSMQAKHARRRNWSGVRVGVVIAGETARRERGGYRCFCRHRLRHASSGHHPGVGTGHLDADARHAER